jgi:putative DNA primase/helicase
MLAAWDEWSQQSDKYQKGECAAKWATFKTDGNGKKRTIASLAKRGKDSTRTGSGNPINQGWVSPTSDIANGKRMARLHGDDLFYTEALGWFTWDGRRFKPDETGRVLRFAKQSSQFIASEAGKIEDKDERDKMLKHASRSQDRSRLEAMVWAARSEADIAAMPDVFDRDAELFNVQNGTLDLRTMQLKPHDRTDRITKVGGAVYDPHADCPAFKAFLHEIFKADVDLIAFYQRLIGYMLTALTSEQGVYILWGGGANGKSVLLKTQSALMGDYAVHTPGETFMVQKNPSVRSDVARLAGARLVTSTEVEDGQRLAETLIKQFSGEDKVTARKLYKAEFEFEPCCKIFIAANHKPVVRGTDYAIWRRINLIPFTFTVPPDRRIPQMAEKRLIPELSGILNWALAGLQAWRDVGLDPPECVTAATEEYKSESDVLADWIEDQELEGAGRSALNSGLRKAYEQHCEDNGIKPIGDKWFGRRLAERGYTRTKIAGVRGWRGLGNVD